MKNVGSQATPTSAGSDSASRGGGAVPANWRHKRGPLHQLLEFQGYRCAICERSFTWEPRTGLEPRQWVRNGLLQALLCYRCHRRYAIGTPEIQDAAIAGRFNAIGQHPPAQECSATKASGAQGQPSFCRSPVNPVESPTTSWRYCGTIIHSLLLWQRGRCPICSTGLQVSSRPQSANVDHDPKTNLIRGLLCHSCNTNLEKEMPPGWWAHNAAFRRAYLKNPPAQVLPATRGRSYRERHHPACVVSSWDGELLSDSLPLSILAGVAVQTWQPTDGIDD